MSATDAEAVSRRREDGADAVRLRCGQRLLDGRDSQIGQLEREPALPRGVPPVGLNVGR
jgi:hypothetical protein